MNDLLLQRANGANGKFRGAARVQIGAALFAAHGQTLCRREPVDLALDCEQSIDALDCLDRDRRLIEPLRHRRSDVSPTSTTCSLAPTLSRRRVKGSISVVTGQTVLLAGLISETQSRGRNGIPFLDQIPVLGEGG